MFPSPFPVAFFSHPSSSIDDVAFFFSLFFSVSLFSFFFFFLHEFIYFFRIGVVEASFDFAGLPALGTFNLPGHVSPLPHFFPSYIGLSRLFTPICVVIS